MTINKQAKDKEDKLDKKSLHLIYNYFEEELQKYVELLKKDEEDPYNNFIVSYLDSKVEALLSQL